jgi:hypothetical protein
MLEHSREGLAEPQFIANTNEILDAVKGFSARVANHQEADLDEVKSALKKLEDTQAVLFAKWEKMFSVVMDIKTVVVRLEDARVATLQTVFEVIKKDVAEVVRAALAPTNTESE